MAGLGKKTFVQGDVLNASEVNGYLMEQAVMKFASATARTTAIPSPTEGMVSWLDDLNQLYIYDGSAWVAVIATATPGLGAWTPYSPSLTNITLGTGGTSPCYFIQIGKTVHARGRLTLGTSPTVTGAITITLPVTASSLATFTGAVNMRAAGLDYPGMIVPSTTTIVVHAIGAAGTYANRVTTSSTIPNTWTSADRIDFSITYEAA